MAGGNDVCDWWIATEEASGRHDVGDVEPMPIWRIGLGGHFPEVFFVRREGWPARARRDSAVRKALRRDPALRGQCRDLLAGYPADLPRWLTDALGREDGRPSLHPARPAAPGGGGAGKADEPGQEPAPPPAPPDPPDGGATEAADPLRPALSRAAALAAFDIADPGVVPDPEALDLLGVFLARWALERVQRRREGAAGSLPQFPTGNVG